MAIIGGSKNTLSSGEDNSDDGNPLSKPFSKRHLQRLQECHTHLSLITVAPFHRPHLPIRRLQMGAAILKHHQTALRRQPLT